MKIETLTQAINLAQAHDPWMIDKYQKYLNTSNSKDYDFFLCSSLFKELISLAKQENWPMLQELLNDSQALNPMPASVHKQFINGLITPKNINILTDLPIDQDFELDDISFDEWKKINESDAQLLNKIKSTPAKDFVKKAKEVFFKTSDDEAIKNTEKLFNQIKSSSTKISQFQFDMNLLNDFSFLSRIEYKKLEKIKLTKSEETLYNNLNSIKTR